RFLGFRRRAADQGRSNNSSKLSAAKQKCHSLDIPSKPCTSSTGPAFRVRAPIQAVTVDFRLILSDGIHLPAPRKQDRILAVVRKERKIMNRQTGRVLAGLCALGMAAVIAAPAGAQTSEVKEKPPLSSYIGNWAIPRAQWADMAKADDADRAVLEKALAGGTIVGFGSDVNLIHRPDGETHDQWWSATSM